MKPVDYCFPFFVVSEEQYKTLPFKSEFIVDDSFIRSLVDWGLLFNVIIDHCCRGCVEWGAEDFLQLESGEKVIIGDYTADVLDLLVYLKIFPSRGQARKNWKGPIQFPPGFTFWRVGKAEAQKLIAIWNPITCLCKERAEDP